MKVHLIRSSDNPVVTTYMDIIQKSIIQAGYECPNVKKGDIIANKKDFVVTDSALVAIKYLFKGFKNHIVWYQGVLPEESYIRNKSNMRFYILSCIEKKILKKAKLVFLVSDEMKKHYEKKYKLDLSEKSIIMPCFNEIGVEWDAFSVDRYTKNNFVYLGGLQGWQCFEQTAELYAEIEKEADGPTKFYVFTAQKDKARETLQKYGVQNFEIDCVPKDELSGRIKEMKYGFVLREDIAVNNVATPTKFSNYLSNGIIPIYSSYIKSFAEFDAEIKFGVVFDFDRCEECKSNILEHMKKEILPEEVKEKCEYAFNTYYNSESYINLISEKVKWITK